MSIDDDPTTGTCDYCAKEYVLGDEEDHCGECGQCNDHCDCEPVTCYNTGGRCHAGCGCDKALAESQARHDWNNRLPRSTSNAGKNFGYPR